MQHRSRVPNKGIRWETAHPQKKSTMEGIILIFWPLICDQIKINKYHKTASCSSSSWLVLVQYPWASTVHACLRQIISEEVCIVWGLLPGLSAKKHIVHILLVYGIISTTRVTMVPVIPFLEVKPSRYITNISGSREKAGERVRVGSHFQLILLVSRTRSFVHLPCTDDPKGGFCSMNRGMQSCGRERGVDAVWWE